MNHYSLRKSRGLYVTGRIRESIDIMLNQDYNRLRAKRNSIFQCGACTSNVLILDYIRNIYEDYQIPDPLVNPVNLTIQRPRQLDVKPHRMSDSNFQTPPHKTTKTQFITHPSTTINKQESQSIFRNPQRNSIVKNFSKQFTSARTFQRHRSYTSELVKIPEIYRYCIACEKAILQANIQFHEQQCKQFQVIYQMEYQDIAKYLDHKINSLKQKLFERTQIINGKDKKALDQAVHGLCTNNYLSKPQLFDKSYQQAVNIGIKWGLALQQASKLRWFSRIRYHLKNQFRL